MKRGYFILIIAFLLFFPSLSVQAADYGIEKYYVDATVETNGDLRVKEAFHMNGSYNGFERVIKFKNDQARPFDQAANEFGGSTIHNGNGIILNKIMGINPSDLDINRLSLINGDIYNESQTSPVNGEYTTFTESDGVTYKIYNASTNGQDFYLDYTLQNMGIIHNDVAELGWNIFGEELNESIHHFELLLHIPNNTNELRAWAHGPLNGDVKIINKQTIRVTIDNLNANTAMDVRAAFDRDVISDSTKLSNTIALPKILNYEQKKADDANRIRRNARLVYYGIYGLSIIWIIGLIIYLVFTYFKYDREYKATFQGEYYREFPNTYGPEIVGYLMNKKVGPNDLSASILNLIYKKIIKAEEIPTNKKKKDYTLTYIPENEKEGNVTESEAKIIKWMFKNAGEGNSIKMSDFTKKAKTSYESFLSSYDSWKNKVTTTAEKYQFYNDKKGRVGIIIYAIIGLLFSFFTIAITENPLLFIPMIVLGIIAIIYAATFTRRSIEGNEEFVKWKAFKKFLTHFGDFTEKELPEIHLWEKYLVYAVTLGCAKKLAKTMEIKAKEYYPGYTGYSYGPSYTDMLIFNQAINTNVNRAVSTALSTKAIAESHDSSGSGFGGGFSSGGGSFGGGGGGGRF